MEQLKIKDKFCSEQVSYFRYSEQFKDKSDIEIVTSLYLEKANEYCKANNVKVKEFSIKLDEYKVYNIEINFDAHGNNNL